MSLFRKNTSNNETHNVTVNYEQMAIETIELQKSIKTNKTYQVILNNFREFERILSTPKTFDKKFEKSKCTVFIRILKYEVSWELSDSPDLWPNTNFYGNPLCKCCDSNASIYEGGREFRYELSKFNSKPLDTFQLMVSFSEALLSELSFTYERVQTETHCISWKCEFEIINANYEPLTEW